MPYVKHYRQGEPIRDVDTLLKQECIYFHGKVVHKGWFMSWQFRYVIGQLQLGTIYTAIKKEEL